MSRTYYEYGDVKVRIAHRLMQLSGWKVYGYHADESDMMTDYYNPAYWHGIAEKNGYRLVVDQRWAAEERRYSVPTVEKKTSDAKAREKIAKLEELTQERGATEAEEAAAKKAIAALLKKEHDEEESETAYKEIIEPGHMANPPRCNWHIEKDGVIIDKGTGLLKFASVPDITEERNLKEWQDFNNLSADEWKEKRARRILNHWNWYTDERASEDAEYQYKEAVKDYTLLEQFNVLINRFDTTCGGMVGNANDFYTYEEITVTEYKKEIKPQETESGEIKEGQHFIVKSHGYGFNICAGYVYIIHERTGTNGKPYYYAQRLNGKHTKELSGTANPANSWGYFFSEKDKERFLKQIAKGSLSWCVLSEVSTPYEVKKVVKKKVSAPSAKNEQPKPEQVREEPAQEQEPEVSAPSAEPETATEPETRGEQAEPAPDMFAELAAAYIKGKTIKAASKAKPEQKPEPEPEPEPKQEPEPEPVPEEPPKPGFSGNDNNSGLFTQEEREKLFSGIPVAKKSEYCGTDVYFSAPYSDNVRLVYSVFSYGGRYNIEPGKAPSYFGFMVDKNLYSNFKPIAEKYAFDVNLKLAELLPDESAAAKSFYASDVPDYEKNRIDQLKNEHDYHGDAKRLFFEGKKPELVLFSDSIESADELINYILNPDKAVENYALSFMCKHILPLYTAWIKYNRISAAFSAIDENPDNEEHRLLKISRSINDEKTVRIELKNGNEVRAEADAVKRMCYWGRISRHDISASDRKYLSGEDIKTDDIVSIRHGGKLLYTA